MKILKHLALAAVLLCGSGLFTACSDSEDASQDNPVVPADQEGYANRTIIHNQIKKDMPLLAEGISGGQLDVTSQALTQLLTLMKLDKEFINDMNTLFIAAARQKALRSLSIVSPESELAEMGYLAYLTADNRDFGLRVLFDGKGGCQALPAKRLEFVFPATIRGIGTTLYKVVVTQSDEYYQSVSSVNAHNIQHLACVTCMPKALNILLSGFIDGKEVKLSESVITLELPLTDGSEYVDVQAGAFKLNGNQTSYSNPSGTSALKYDLSVDGDNMGISYTVSNNGTQLIGCDAEMVLKQKDSFINRMGNKVIDFATINAFTIHILDDITIKGDVTDGAAFAQLFIQGIMTRQQSNTADSQQATAESFNELCPMQISCTDSQKEEAMKLCAVERGGKYMIEPAIQNLEGNAFIPVSSILDAQTVESLDKSFGYSLTPAASVMDATLDFYSTIIQMMLLSKLPQVLQ